jgi:hypothetical protein
VAAAVGLIIGSISACSFLTGSARFGGVSVKPTQDTAWLTARYGGSFEIPLLIHNTSTDTLYAYWCGTRAERLIDGAWETVFIPNCLDVESPYPIPPGGVAPFRWTLGGLGIKPRLRPAFRS